jgi:hypothetical protein
MGISWDKENDKYEERCAILLSSNFHLLIWASKEIRSYALYYKFPIYAFFSHPSVRSLRIAATAFHNTASMKSMRCYIITTNHPSHQTGKKELKEGAERSVEMLKRELERKMAMSDRA